METVNETSIILPPSSQEMLDVRDWLGGVLPPTGGAM